MKKALKSVMASALAVAMMIIASVACVASPYTADGISDSMIVKWDFNGEGEEALSDKATADGVSSNLTAVGDVVMNGSTAKVSEVNSSSLKTAAFEGFKDLVSTTIYMKVRITAQASNYECMFYVSNKLRIMTNNSAKFNVRATAGHNPNLTALTFPVNENYEWNNGDWIYVALAFNGNAVDPQTTLYASADGINYSYVSTDKAGSATTVSKMLGSTSVSVILGQYNADEPKATFEYDEVRIYNRALSEQEVKSISAQSIQPVFAGVQNTVADSESGLQSIRFLGTVDSLEYKEIGFYIELDDSTAEGTKMLRKTDRIVCTTVNAIGEDGNVCAVEASELGGQYIFALTINSVPTLKSGETDRTLTFRVTPVATDLDGNDVFGVCVTVTYVNGEFVSAKY